MRVRWFTWVWQAKPCGDLQSTVTKAPAALSVLVFVLLSAAVMKKLERGREI